MPENFELLNQVNLTAAGITTLVTGAADEGTIIRHIRVVNNDSGDVATFAMWQGGTLDANATLPASTIEAGGWAEFDGTMIVNNLEVVSGEAIGAGTTDVTVSLYGLQMTS